MSVFNRFFSLIFGCLLVVSGVVVFTDGIGLTYVLESVAQMWRGGAAGAITCLLYTSWYFPTSFRSWPGL